MKLLLLIIILHCVPLAAAAQGNIYALIVSGGRSKLYNHERYWNDCALIYRALRQTYQVPKERITLLMADGDNPAEDLLLDQAAGFASTPTDLDGDGKADLRLAATSDNLRNVLSELSLQLTPSDHLFIFIANHGLRSTEGDGTLLLWGNDRMSSRQLGDLLRPLRAGSVNVLIGSCHSEAFMAGLQAERRIITTACSADELSWSCPDRPYDEFIYHWACAIARHDEQGNAVDADTNGDGHVSMLEAYYYAQRHDRRPETPCLWAAPQQLADQWTFGGLLGQEAGIGRLQSEDNPPRHTYDLLGRPADTHSRKGIYLRNGKIVLNP